MRFVSVYMKKIFLILLIVFVVVGSAFAADIRHGISFGLGPTPTIVAYELDIERFNIDLEAKIIGGRLDFTYDVLPSMYWDIDLGVGFGAVNNPIVSLLTLMLSFGQAQDPWLLDAGAVAKFTYNFNEHNGIFIKYALPVFYGTPSNMGLINFTDFKSCLSHGLLSNAEIGYKHTF